MFIVKHFKPLLLSMAMLAPFNCLADQLKLIIPELAKDGFTSKFISNQFGCTGDNISPQIEWQNVPTNAKSLVLTMYDPDAPTGSGWWHWQVVNIPVQSQLITESAGNQPKLLPKGSQLIRNDYGTINYGGPCPPENSNHRYQFTLYALDIDRIDVTDQTTPAMIGFIANAHQIAKTSITYHYTR